MTTGNHVVDNYDRQMQAEEKWECEKRAEAESLGVVSLYERWRDMSGKERWTELQSNGMLREVQSETRVYAFWHDDELQNLYPLDEPVGTFDEVESFIPDPEPRKESMMKRLLHVESTIYATHHALSLHQSIKDELIKAEETIKILREFFTP